MAIDVAKKKANEHAISNRGSDDGSKREINQMPDHPVTTNGMKPQK
jgi:hypothetical protein